MSDQSAGQGTAEATAASDRPFVSVIVAARNAESTMPALLAALTHQTIGRERYEVLIVDDCSTDETAAIVGRDRFARLLRTPARGGAYVARNVGLREARGDVIAITDADCVPAADWLERGLTELETTDVDMVGGHIDVPLSENPSLCELVDFARFLDQERTLREGGFAATANLIARRSVFDAVGKFNEHVISGGDRELSLRATAAGFKLIYSPTACVSHKPRVSARELAKRCYRMGYGIAQMARHAAAPAGEGSPKLWLHPGAYKPSRTVYGIERVHEQGYHLSRRERVGMSLCQHLCVQLPMIAGNIMGSLRETLGR